MNCHSDTRYSARSKRKKAYFRGRGGGCEDQLKVFCFVWNWSGSSTEKIHHGRGGGRRYHTRVHLDPGYEFTLETKRLLSAEHMLLVDNLIHITHCNIHIDVYCRPIYTYRLANCYNHDPGASLRSEYKKLPTRPSSRLKIDAEKASKLV